MSIETLEDWNDALDECGCCNMPSCPLPHSWLVDYMYSFLKGVYANPNTADNAWSGVLFKRVLGTYTYYHSGSYLTTKLGTTEETINSPEVSLYSNVLRTGGSYEEEVTFLPNPINGSFTVCHFVPTDRNYLAGTTTNKFNGAVQPAVKYNGFVLSSSNYGPVTITVAGSNVRIEQTLVAAGVTNTFNNYYQDNYSPSEAYNAIKSVLDGIPWGGPFPVHPVSGAIANGGTSIGSNKVLAAENRTVVAPIGKVKDSRIEKIRVRFRVPVSHTGTKFYITYDLYDTPITYRQLGNLGAASIIGTPVVYSKDNMIEWTGPGTGDADNPSWFFPSVIIDPPAEPGTRRMYNIRYSCYSGQFYGSKPQVIPDTAV